MGTLSGRGKHVPKKRYSRKFQRMAVERMETCEDVAELAQELGVTRRCLYKWRTKLDGVESREESARPALDHTMISSRLTVAALERAVTERQPPAGLVHHSDRGLQYASPAYVAALEKYGIVASMSRPANPYDNASCESFMKTLKREEIYANRYRDLEHLHANVEEFIEQYYNQQRLHSALGYQSPVEFEQRNAGVAVDCRSATMMFFENNVNEQRASPELSGEGDSSAAPFPRPQPLPGDTKAPK
jgi:transposase InsO family protein